MEQNSLNLKDNIFSNNITILSELINDLYNLMNNTKDIIIIQILGKIINKMNYIINENKKNLDLIRDDINKIYNQINNKFDELKTISIKEIITNNGDKYIGQVLNGIPDGKGIAIILMVIYMKEAGNIIGEKEKEQCIITMVIYIKVIILLIK